MKVLLLFYYLLPIFSYSLICTIKDVVAIDNTLLFSSSSSFNLKHANGIQLYHNKSFVEAVEYFKTQIFASSSSSSSDNTNNTNERIFLYHQLALSYHYLGDLQQAESMYQMAFSIGEEGRRMEEHQMYFDYGVTLQHLGKVQSYYRYLSCTVV